MSYQNIKKKKFDRKYGIGYVFKSIVLPNWPVLSQPQIKKKKLENIVKRRQYANNQFLL